jgi:hypothetical protein
MTRAAALHTDIRSKQIQDDDCKMPRARPWEPLPCNKHCMCDVCQSPGVVSTLMPLTLRPLLT